MNYLKLTVILAAGAYGLSHAIHPERFGLVDYADILFHEAGHPIFGMFGNEFLGVLGGTLMQLLMPVGVGIYFFMTGQLFSSAVSGVWAALNLFNISVYANDAWEMALPLVGNGDRIHDWNYMLDSLDILHRYKTVSFAIHASGVCVLVVSVLAGLWLSRKGADGDK